MMNKKNCILLFAFGVAIIFGCKKDGLNDFPSETLVKTETHGNVVKSYSYDNHNRLILEKTDMNSNYYITHAYKYKGDTVIIFSVDSNNVKIRIMPYYLLNNKKLMVYEFPPFEYTYDNNDFIVTAIGSFRHSYLDSFYNDSNNITKRVQRMYNIYSYTYTITTIKQYNDTLNTLGNNNFGKSYLGKSSKNLISYETVINEKMFCQINIGCGLSQIVDINNYKYCYELDRKNRVTKVIKTNVATLETDTTSYTYY